jgi:hypothetical protein
MNIFVLDNDPQYAAIMMCDKHVVKMIVESCQLMSTAHHVLDGQEIVRVAKNGRKFHTYETTNLPGSPNFLRCTMINHPCTIWTRESISNYQWVWVHTNELLHQYSIRYNKDHTYTNLVKQTLVNAPRKLQALQQTPFAQAMPDQYKNRDAVEAYRQYYIHEKARFAKWKAGNTPLWFSEGVNSINTVQT